MMRNAWERDLQMPVYVDSANPPRDPGEGREQASRFTEVVRVNGLLRGSQEHPLRHVCDQKRFELGGGKSYNRRQDAVLRCQVCPASNGAVPSGRFHLRSRTGNVLRTPFVTAGPAMTCPTRTNSSDRLVVDP